jgi:enoyl-CoA hydratase/carnithine racemase
MMPANHITLTAHGLHGCITLHRAVLDRGDLKVLQDILTETTGRYSAIVMTGSNGAFCEGFDLSGAGGGTEYSRQGHTQTEIVEAIRKHPAVFIAAVNGTALSDGVSLINVCDLAIAAEGAEMALPEIGQATYPAVAGPSTQLRILRKHASWMILTGKRVDAPTAARWGLINTVVPAAALMDEAHAVAERVAALNPVTVDWSKKAMDDIPSHVSDWTAALEYGRAVTAVIQNQIGRENSMPKKF